MKSTDIFEDDSDEVISDQEDNNDTRHITEEVENKGASHNMNQVPMQIIKKKAVISKHILTLII